MVTAGPGGFGFDVTSVDHLFDRGAALTLSKAFQHRIEET